MNKIMVIYGSSRRNGNTDFLEDKKALKEVAALQAEIHSLKK
ncbi:hypothetical protein [Virgibacillus necropolis]|nr:hypothetical protein [Virgibacillus necropolis]